MTRLAKSSMRSQRVMPFPGLTHRQPLARQPCDEALLNHLERFGYDIRKVGNIKVREVGAEYRPQPKAHPRIEGP